MLIFLIKSTLFKKPLFKLYKYRNICLGLKGFSVKCLKPLLASVQCITC